ncbi:MAG: threonine--tRNA ligase [Nitrososphaerales archaeon]
MRILQLHSDYIEYKPLNKEISLAEEVEKKNYRFDDLVVLFTSIEKDDDEKVIDKALLELKEFLNNLKVNKILIYPFAHLSSNLAEPDLALYLLKLMEKRAKDFGIETYRAPFGWNKQFSIQIKGHPLAEQSRSYIKGEIERKEEAFEIGCRAKSELEVLWHTTAHVLALAVKSLYPEVKRGLVGISANGFYYDFYGKRFSKDDLEKIEKEMERISKEIRWEKLELSKEQAKKIFPNEEFKLEVIELLKREKVSLIKFNGYYDICDGELSNSKVFFKLRDISGAYWKGKASNPMLYRISGISFGTQRELDEYLDEREKLERRDHRYLGKTLGLFHFKEEAPGSVFFYEKGVLLRNLFIELWKKEHYKQGYKEIITPLLMNKELWVKSGHWETYKENIFLTKVEGSEFVIKPMNCPGAILTYLSEERSYKDLPLRLAELGLVHRQELSGVLSGLFRVRAFTQDDAHIFVAEEQLEDEVLKVIKLVDKFYRLFGFEYSVELSTKPEKALGSDKVWEKATKHLINALNKANLKYRIKEKEGAFYGPKLDFHIKDSLGRSWQCATIQVDFVMPERFNLSYIGKDGKEHTPVIIHRVIYGSLERFIGIVVEHYGGAFPFWLAPVQIAIIPVSDEYLDYCKEIAQKLELEGFRVTLDTQRATVSYKIREAQIQKIPYMIVIGSKEKERGKVSLRSREGKVEQDLNLEELIARLKEQAKTFAD